MARQALIKLRRGTGAPGTNVLAEGELAIDIAAKKLYSANSSGSAFTLSGDQYNFVPSGNSTQASLTLTVDNDALSNDNVTFVGTGGITVSGNSTQVTVDAATGVDYDLTAGGTAATGTIILGGDSDADTVTITGNNGLVVSNTSTSAMLVENKGSQHVVTVVNDGGNKYQIDGTTQQNLRLVPGMIYWFDQSDNTNATHPLVFGTAANGSEVSEGSASGFEIYEKVGTPGSAGSYTRIKLQQDAPNSVYYFCSAHSGMGASAFVQPDNLYSNATHVVATQPISVPGTSVFATLDISGDVDIDGTLETDALSLNGTAVSADATELNKLDGATSSTAELNYVTGVTSGIQGQLDTLTSGKVANGQAVTFTTFTASGLSDLNGDLEVAGLSTLTGNATASANLNVGGGLGITGALTGSTLTMSGLADLNGNLEVAGLSTLTGNTTVSDTLTVADGMLLTGGTIVIGNSTVNAVITQAGDISTDGSLTVTGGSDLNGALDVAGLSTLTGNVTMSDDASVGGDLTVSGNFTVSGTQTIVSSSTVALTDSMLKLAQDQTGTDTDAVDIGFYGVYDEGGTDKYTGLFRDQSDSNKKFVLVDGITAEPGTTVTYAATDLAYLEAIIDGGTY